MSNYDVFTFYNEVDMLDFRLHHVYDHVDKIVIVEGDRTYTGRPYKSNYLKHKERYAWAEDKIIHTVVPMIETPHDRWANEAWQRNHALDGLDLKKDDVVFFSCVDEIIDHAFYDMSYNFKEPNLLSLDNYYYYFNGKDVGEKPDHPMPIVFPYSAYTGSLHAMWINRHNTPAISNAGWHFSYLGGIDQIVQKLEAYSHSEHDTDEVKDNLKSNIAKGNDIFGRPDHVFKYVKIDKSFPPYLYENQDKFKELIHAS